MEKVNVRDIDVAGIGAAGSAVAYAASKHFSNAHISVYDFDKVEEHNVKSQIYRLCDVGNWKSDAIRNYLLVMNSYNTKLKDEIITTDWLHLGFDNFESRIGITSSCNAEIISDIRIERTFMQIYAFKTTGNNIDTYLKILKEDKKNFVQRLSDGERCTTRSGFYAAQMAAAICLQMVDSIAEGLGEWYMWTDDMKLMIK